MKEPPTPLTATCAAAAVIEQKGGDGHQFVSRGKKRAVEMALVQETQDFVGARNNTSSTMALLAKVQWQ